MRCANSKFPIPNAKLFLSDQALIHHRLGNLEESGDVRTVDVVAGSAEHLGGLAAAGVNRPHDLVETIVYFLTRPREAHAVLRHLQARRRDAASVGCLGGTIQDLRVEKLADAV